MLQEGDALDFDRIVEAQNVIPAEFLRSPQYVSPRLSAAGAVGMPILLKVETLNPLRSFKGRGPAYFVQRLVKQPGYDGRGLCTASVGNFGQGIAYACRTAKLRVTIFAARTASPVKVAAMRALGAEVILQGDDFDDALVAAKAHAAAAGLRWVQDGEEPEIAEGNGTIGVELAAARPAAVFVPVGNGALIAGIGAALRRLSPETKVIGVCSTGAPCMERSFRDGVMHPTDSIDTFCDGIGVREPIPRAVRWMREYVDDCVLVDDAEVLRAMRLLRDAEGVLTEGAGAAGIAAAARHGARWLGGGGPLAAVVCGANFTDAQRKEWYGA